MGRLFLYCLVASTKWQVAATSCRVACTKWQVAAISWQVACTKWQVAATSWQVASTKWQVAAISWQVASTKWQVAAINWLAGASRMPLRYKSFCFSHSNPIARGKLSHNYGHKLVTGAGYTPLYNSRTTLIAEYLSLNLPTKKII